MIYDFDLSDFFEMILILIEIFFSNDFDNTEKHISEKRTAMDIFMIWSLFDSLVMCVTSLVQLLDASQLVYFSSRSIAPSISI